MNVYFLAVSLEVLALVAIVMVFMLKSKSKIKKSGQTSAGRNIAKFSKQAKAAPHILVGWPATERGAAKYPNSDVSVIAVAIWNEFGTKTMPERSFLRSTMRKNRQEYRRMIATASKKAIRNQANLDVSLRRIGLIAVGDIQRTITQLKSPPNAPGTIRAKKSSNPLIDTSFMRATTTFGIRHGRNGKI